MYDKSSFINDDETDVVCVIRAAEGVGIGEDIQAKFIKIVIIWFIYHCWFCSICISKFIISNVCSYWKYFIFCLFSLIVFFKNNLCINKHVFNLLFIKIVFFISLLIFIFMTSSDCPCCLRAQIYSTTIRVDFILL